VSSELHARFVHHSTILCTKYALMARYLQRSIASATIRRIAARCGADAKKSPVAPAARSSAMTGAISDTRARSALLEASCILRPGVTPSAGRPAGGYRHSCYECASRVTL
jgi:hypothetical protein